MAFKAQCVSAFDQVGDGAILMHDQVPIWPNAVGVSWNILKVDETLVWCILVELGFPQRELNQFDV